MPTLVVIGGPDAGKKFFFARSAVLGRGAEADVALSDPQVAARHARVFHREGDPFLRTLFGNHGVSVGGRPVKDESPLSQGDLIALGGTALIFSEDERIDVPETLGKDEAESLARSTRFRHAHKPQSRAIDLLTLGGEAAAQKVGSLLDFSRAIGSLDAEEAIYKALLEFIFENFESDRATVMTFDPFKRGFRVAAKRSRAAGAKAVQKPISRAILREVYRTKDFLLLEDAREDSRFDTSQSVVAQEIRSVMAAPLMARDEMLGMVTVDSTTRAGVFKKQDLGFLGAAAMHAATAVERARLTAEVREKLLLENELQNAATIQQRLLPKGLTGRSDIEVTGLMIPARGVGGDYYDFVEKGGDVFVAIGDVSGKGTTAGLVMMMARTYFRSLVEMVDDPGEIVRRLNNYMVQDTASGSFMSFLLLKWTEGDAAMAASGAGHEHILHLDAATRTVTATAAGGMVLGIKTRPPGDTAVHSIPFAPGDTILLYSDGVTEAMVPGGRMYELHRLKDALFRNAEKTPAALAADILAEVRSLVGEAPQSDDITLVVLRRRGA